MIKNVDDLLKKSVEKDLHNIQETKIRLENLKSVLPEEMHYDFDNIENILYDLESFLSEYSDFIPIIEGFHNCFENDEDKMIIRLRISCRKTDLDPMEYLSPMIKLFAKNTLWFLNKVLNQPVYVSTKYGEVWTEYGLSRIEV